MFRELLYCALLVVVASFSYGPPPEACQSMTPDPRADPVGHGTAPETRDAPYVIVASSSCYGGDNNSEITVTVMSVMEECLPMEGLFLQAKPTATTGHMANQNAGTWDVNGNTEELQSMTCLGNANSALSQKMKLPYRRTVEVKWTGPTTDEGSLTIYGTLVRSQSKFFVGVASAPIIYSATCGFDIPTAETPEACEETGMGEGGPGSSSEEHEGEDSSSAATIYGITTVLAITVLLYATLVKRA